MIKKKQNILKYYYDLLLLDAGNLIYSIRLRVVYRQLNSQTDEPPTRVNDDNNIYACKRYLYYNIYNNMLMQHSVVYINKYIIYFSLCRQHSWYMLRGDDDDDGATS